MLFTKATFDNLSPNAIRPRLWQARLELDKEGIAGWRRCILSKICSEPGFIHSLAIPRHVALARHTQPIPIEKARAVIERQAWRFTGLRPSFLRPGRRCVASAQY
jgi:hypothetical protein